MAYWHQVNLDKQTGNTNIQMPGGTESQLVIGYLLHVTTGKCWTGEWFWYEILREESNTQIQPSKDIAAHKYPIMVYSSPEKLMNKRYSQAAVKESVSDLPLPQQGWSQKATWRQIMQNQRWEGAQECEQINPNKVGRDHTPPCAVLPPCPLQSYDGCLRSDLGRGRLRPAGWWRLIDYVTRGGTVTSIISTAVVLYHSRGGVLDRGLREGDMVSVAGRLGQSHVARLCRLRWVFDAGNERCTQNNEQSVQVKYVGSWTNFSSQVSVPTAC